MNFRLHCQKTGNTLSSGRYGEDGSERRFPAYLRMAAPLSRRNTRVRALKEEIMLHRFICSSPRIVRQLSRALSVTLLLSLSPIALASDTISFQLPVTYAVGAGADSPVAGDIDQDGHVDLAIVNQTMVAVLYGRGDGTFDPPMNYAVGGNITEIILTDVDGNGTPDLVMSDFFSEVELHHSVSVLRNQGSRTFSSPAHYPVGLFPFGVTADDFNGDNRPDLAVTNDESHTMSVLLNNGDGTFGPATDYGAGFFPARVKSADFNGDGFIDLAQSNYVYGDINIYFGNGDGTFSYGGNYIVGDYLPQILVEDFDGDGTLDLATTDYWTGQVSVLVGNGNGTFQAPTYSPANGLPAYMDSGDLNGDGLPDLAVPNAGSNQFTVLANTGGGTFAPPVSFVSGGTDVRSLTIGDFNEDGLLDVAATNSSQATVSIFINSTRRVVSSLTLTPNSLTGGCQNATGTVTLSSPAPEGGALVALSSDNPAASVPATVLVPEGALSATFPVVTSAVAGLQTATVTASYNTTSQSAQLTLQPIGVSLLEIIPDPVRGGKKTTAQVTLECPAAPGAITVTLTSSHPSIAPVPTTLTIPAGASSATFTIKTTHVNANTQVTITATANGKSASRVLTVTP
jgi:hypothetical protein